MVRFCDFPAESPAREKDRRPYILYIIPIQYHAFDVFQAVFDTFSQGFRRKNVSVKQVEEMTTVTTSDNAGRNTLSPPASTPLFPRQKKRHKRKTIPDPLPPRKTGAGRRLPPENAGRPPCRFPCADPCGLPSCPGFPRFVTPGQAAYAGSGFAPSSADYHITSGERSQHGFGPFSPGNASPEHRFRPCSNFLNRFGRNAGGSAFLPRPDAFFEKSARAGLKNGRFGLYC